MNTITVDNEKELNLLMGLISDISKYDEVFDTAQTFSFCLGFISRRMKSRKILGWWGWNQIDIPTSMPLSK